MKLKRIPERVWAKQKGEIANGYEQYRRQNFTALPEFSFFSTLFRTEALPNFDEKEFTVCRKETGKTLAFCYGFAMASFFANAKSEAFGVTANEATFFTLAEGSE